MVNPDMSSVPKIKSSWQHFSETAFIPTEESDEKSFQLASCFSFKHSATRLSCIIPLDKTTQNRTLIIQISCRTMLMFTKINLNHFELTVAWWSLFQQLSKPKVVSRTGLVVWWRRCPILHMVWCTLYTQISLNHFGLSVTVVWCSLASGRPDRPTDKTNSRVGSRTG